jgi:hypothetical protein
MSIIEHDFGWEKRQVERRFRQLLGLDALHEANVRANPLPYLERASERIYQLEGVLFEAVQAANHVADRGSSVETVEVDAAEYERLLNCRAIVEQGLADLNRNAGDN